MKYLCLVYGDENELHSVPDRECLAYDADLRALRRIDVWIRVEAASAPLRNPDGRSVLRWVPDRTLQASVALRNAP